MLATAFVIRATAVFCGVLLVFSTLLGFVRAQPPSFRWAVYYADTAPPEAFTPFDMVVFDSDRHPDIGPLRARKGLAIGYLSVGEVHRTRGYFDEVAKQGLLLDENPNWPGAFAVDIRDPRWHARVLGELVPAILARGFDGVFLDTVDTGTDLERRDRVRFAGATLATIDLVRAIKRRHPTAVVVLNRGYDILPAVENAVDMVLAESLVTAWDFENNRPRMAPVPQHEAESQMLREAAGRNPGLRLLALEYWPPEDRAMLKEIYAKVRALGFAPYVATVALDRVVPEPR
jgi:uncharacterized protein (TIGR01370 family)